MTPRQFKRDHESGRGSSSRRPAAGPGQTRDMPPVTPAGRPTTGPGRMSPWRQGLGPDSESDPAVGSALVATCAARSGPVRSSESRCSRPPLSRRLDPPRLIVPEHREPTTAGVRVSVCQSQSNLSPSGGPGPPEGPGPLVRGPLPSDSELATPSRY